MPVEVHLEVLVEDTVPPLDGLSVHTLSEITWRLGYVVDWVLLLPRIRLIEGKEPFRT